MLGLIGRKVGMTQVFDQMGKLTPVTVIKIESNIVIAERKVERDGYSAVVIGAVEGKEKHFTKAVLGQFPEGQKPQRVLVEFKDFGKDVKIGDALGIEVLDGLSHVDVLGTSKGKGFQGVVKRHGFKGGPRTHGQKHSEREPGSIGSTAPQRVFKGTRMAGRTGGERMTVKNLKIIKIDKNKNELWISGAVPGKRGTLLEIKSSETKLK